MKTKVAIVTGGVRGIGLGAAKNLVKRGYKICVCSRHEKDVLKAVSILKKEGEKVLAGNAMVEMNKGVVRLMKSKKLAGSKALAIANNSVLGLVADVSSEADWKKITDAVVKKWGRIDVLANNAGILLQKDIMSTSLEDMKSVLNVNFLSAFLGVKAVVPYMKKQNGGRIVNTASIAGLKAYPYLSAYCASKHAVIGLTKVAAVEFAPFNIRVNAVCPGAVETPMTVGMKGDKKQMAETLSGIPLGRMGKPEELGAVIGFLADEESSFVTGSVYTADGGDMA